MNKLWTIIKQTYTHQVKSWSFVIFVLSPFLMFAIVGLSSYYAAESDEADTSDQIAVISDQKSLRRLYINQNKSDVNKEINTQAAAKKAVNANDIAGYLVVNSNASRVSATYHGTDSMDYSLNAKTTVFLNSVQQRINYSKANLQPDQAQTLATQPQFSQKINGNQNATKKIAKILSFWIIVVAIYIILINYASVVANEIASEKGTKIMEIIFSSTTATKYFYGKILGIVGVIVTQILLYLVGGWAIFQGLKHLKLVHELLTTGGPLIKQVLQNILNANLLFLLLGVVIYTILAAFSGALVSSTDEASKAAQPTVYLSMLAFFLTIPFQDNASALVVKILSYVPFFSSFFMPLRIMDHSVSWVGISISLLVLLAAIILSAIYIGHIYGGLMLQTDNSSFWKRFRRGLAYSKS